MKRARHKRGSVVLDKRRGTWSFLWCENGHRRTLLIGSANQFPTKKSAWDQAEKLKDKSIKDSSTSSVLRVENIVTDYRQEKMPVRLSTRRGYDAWINNHILPRWRDCLITQLQARPVELWLQSLRLSPKSKVHIRGIIQALWEYVMWRGDLPTQRNPMELVTIKGATKRTRQPHSLTVEEFHLFLEQLMEPFRVIALICVCFGLRISECLALKWSDVDWLNSRLRIERAIVRQHVDDVKTIYSGKSIAISGEMLEVLKSWRLKLNFLPMKIGCLRAQYSLVGYQSRILGSGLYSRKQL